MKTRVIQTRFWKDSYISELTPNEKLVYIYLLTCDRVNIIHCFEITDKEIAFDTGIDTPMITSIKGVLAKHGKIAFHKNFICLLNAYKYESFEGNLNDKAKERLIKEMGEEIEEWYRGIYTPLIPTRNKKSEIRNYNTEIINQKLKKELENIEY